MRWGKFVLVFQAIITLFFSMVFFVQVVSLDREGIMELNIEVSDSITQSEDSGTIQIDIKDRYKKGGYVLFMVAIIELVIISRFIG
jgi:hypothetical protein